MATEVFASLIKIYVGKGNRVFLWFDRWINGMNVQDIVQAVFHAISIRRRNKRTVQEGFENNSWTRDIISELSPEVFLQFV
jgi:hypothetical protein